MLLAVRSEGLAETVDASGASSGLLSGKIVIDCGNAVYLPDFSQVRWDGRSLAEQFEFHAIGSRVVKAFNLCEASVWRSPATYGGHPFGTPGDQSETDYPPERLAEHLLADAADPRVQVGIRARLFPQRDEHHRDPSVPDNRQCGPCRAVG